MGLQHSAFGRLGEVLGFSIRLKGAKKVSLQEVVESESAVYF